MLLICIPYLAQKKTIFLFQSESDKHERARGSIQLAGAVISPSDEDSYTFTVSPAAGESYKLRATDTRDRQMWLNRLRVIAEMHTRAIAHVGCFCIFMLLFVSVTKSI